MAYAVHITGDEQRSMSHFGQSHRCFTSGMACAYDDTGKIAGHWLAGGKKTFTTPFPPPSSL